MDTEIEQIYLDYLSEAKFLQKGSLDKVLPFLILGAVFLCGGISSILWAGYRTMPTLIFLGIVTSLVIEIVGIIIQTRWLKEQTARIAQTRTGFPEFLKFYNRRWWPKQMVTDKKYDQFLEIIGRKRSA
jgi:hypothetical protein